MFSYFVSVLFFFVSKGTIYTNRNKEKGYKI